MELVNRETAKGTLCITLDGAALRFVATLAGKEVCRSWKVVDMRQESNWTTWEKALGPGKTHTLDGKVGLLTAEAAAMSEALETAKAIKTEADRAEREAARQTKRGEVLAQMPAGCVLLRFSRSEADGSVAIYTDEAGTEIRSPKLVGGIGTGWNWEWAWMAAADYQEAAAVANVVQIPVVTIDSAAFAEAATTGKRVMIRHYMDNCRGSWRDRQECSLDHITVWANPDGTATETAEHTH